MLTQFGNLERLNLETLHFEPDGLVKNCEAIAKCSSLTEFKLERSASDSASLRMDLEFIGEMTFLRSLFVNYCSDDEVTAIAQLADLESLEIELFDTSKHDHAPDPNILSELRDLRYLTINGRHGQSLNFLGELRRLVRLELNGVGIEDVNALANLTDLEELNAADLAIVDCSVVRNLRQLRILKVASVTGNTSTLKSLPLVEELTITDCKNEVVDYLPKSLKKLELNGDEVVDFPDQLELPNLTFLSLGTPLKRTEFFESLRGLTDLRIRGADVDIDLQFSHQLKKLEYLSISECECKNVVSLSNHPSLTTVILPDSVSKQKADQLSSLNPNCEYR